MSSPGVVEHPRMASPSPEWQARLSFFLDSPATARPCGNPPGMKTVRVLGACLHGTGAELVTVEARFDPRDRERTEVVLTGLPDPVLRESRGRLECALSENGLRLASGRLYLNLVPAARRKSGEILDLPLALGAAAASGHFEAKVLRGTLFLGEMGIDGALHAVPGGLAAAIAAREKGVTRVIAPRETASEAACLAGMEGYVAKHLAAVVAHVTGNGTGAQRLDHLLGSLIPVLQ